MTGAPAKRPLNLVEILLILLIGGVLVGIGVVRLGRAELASSETTAIASLRAINAAQAAYASSCGAAGYAQSLDDLGRPPAGASQGFLSPDIAGNGSVKNKYVLSMQSDNRTTIVTPVSRACNSPKEHLRSGYFASAIPVLGSGNTATFATDKRAVIYRRDDGVPISPGMYGAVPVK